MKYTHIFLDYDETLFNHHSHADWVDEQLAKLLGKPAGFYKGRFGEFHQQMEDPLLRLYKHDEHFRATAGRGWDYISGELQKLLKDRREDFCYPDAHPLLQDLEKLPADVRILTYGDDGYQRYKLSTCKMIQQLGIPIHVVHEPKRDFLGREFADAKGVLVDDKYSLGLPLNWDEIWIDRGKFDASHDEASPKIRRVTSLAEIISLLR